MLRTRLWVGTLLALAAGGVLVGDAFFAPTYPVLLACVLALGWLSGRELLSLFSLEFRPGRAPTVCCVLAVLASNWWFLVTPARIDSLWLPVLTVTTASVLVALLGEMARYERAGASVVRVALQMFAVCYLGLLPSFFIRLRWLPEASGLALAAAVFVPKCGDIGAYATGRLFGRHPFTPRLSPKKTWEGFVGGMLFAVATAIGVGQLGPLFRHGTGHAVAFGLAVGLAGVLGDLAESMIKRDGLVKDASAAIPGFGGVLDVIDSVVFAAPVAYAMLLI